MLAAVEFLRQDLRHRGDVWLPHHGKMIAGHIVEFAVRRECGPSEISIAEQPAGAIFRPQVQDAPLPGLRDPIAKSIVKRIGVAAG